MAKHPLLCTFSDEELFIWFIKPKPVYFGEPA